MRYWDVFHAARLEAERSLTTEAVRKAITRGDLLPDDLVRPAGETGWTRVSESPEFAALVQAPDETDDPPPPEPAALAPPLIEAEFDVLVEDRGESGFEIDPDAFAAMDRDEIRRAETESDDDSFDFLPAPEPDPEEETEPDPRAEPMPTYRQASSVTALPIELDDEIDRPDHDEINDPIRDIDLDEYDPQDEDDEAAEFTLSRKAADRVEELDLAAMVDVAFQLVLFFLVTAQVVLFKTLEIPKPNEDKPPDAAVQARAKSIDELEKDYILVEVDAAGTIRIDRQPVAAQRAVLVEKLRKTREDTHRTAMLLSADFATRHEHAVLVFDVANEIDLKIAIAQPAAKK